jgi:hypothetical protein
MKVELSKQDIANVLGALNVANVTTIEHMRTVVDLADRLKAALEGDAKAEKPKADA